MRRFAGFALILVLVVLGACARASSDIDKLQPGTALTVSMKDGSTLSGRVVQVKPDAVVIDPAEGGEWKTVSRDQIASINTQQPGATAAPQPLSAQTPEAAPPAAAPPAQPEPEPPRSTPSRRSTAPKESPRPSNAAPPPPAAPEYRELTIPSGTTLHVRLENAVASDTSKVEDPVRGSLTQPVLIDGVEALGSGTALRGVVTQATASGRVKGRAELAFRFDTLTTKGGDQHRIQTSGVEMEAESTTKKDALKIGVGAGAGAIIGGIVGGGKGAAIGTAVGGGAGTATVLATKGKEVRLEPGATVKVKLAQPLTVRVPMDR